jgi:hypothetical protein
MQHLSRDLSTLIFNKLLEGVHTLLDCRGGIADWSGQFSSLAAPIVKV